MGAPAWIRWPDGHARMAFGGDYNPEQWDRTTWLEDARLMQAAGVNLVNVAVFGWAQVEPAPGMFDFTLYDEVLDLLHEHGVAVDLANATASPPAWLVAADRDVLPRNQDGTVLEFGARQSWCLSSTNYRDHALALTRAMAEHFASHPALAMWHVSNELGCHNSRCYCDRCAIAFREWLEARHSDLAGLNAAWGTSFWSQRYSAWDQVQPPRTAPASPNPAQVLDFQRFCNDTLLAQYRAERDELRRVTPHLPVTTNFMVMGDSHALDYATWSSEVDIVSNDHYLLEGDPEPHIELALSADVVRGLAGGAPWLQMESATGAVNWGRINVPKAPGQLRRNAFAQVARGADGIGFFQWRASTSGAEKYHSAMLPHAGPDTRVHAEVTALGADLARLDTVVGSRVEASVALLYDWESWWASEGDCHPSAEFRYRDAVMDVYRPLWLCGVTLDIVPIREVAGLDAARHPVALAPALHLVTPKTAAALCTYVEAGGTLLVTYFSGVVDAQDRVWEGGAPGPLSDLLGLRVDEVHPLPPGHSVELDDGSVVTDWMEDLAVADASVVSRYLTGTYVDRPALTRRAHGGGTAWYLGARLLESARASLLVDLCSRAEIRSNHHEPGLEVVRRRATSGATFTIAINHAQQNLPLQVFGHELLNNRVWNPGDPVSAGGVVVVREGKTVEAGPGQN